MVRETKDVGKAYIMQKYSFEQIKQLLFERYGYIYVSGDFVGIDSKLIVKDKDGYMYLCNVNKIIYRGTKSKLVHTSNPYSLHNIKLYVDRNTNGEFECISNEYKNNKTPLLFRHKSCGRIFENKWINICRGRYKESYTDNKTGLFCPHCNTKQLESTHALVLKQIWCHEHPDTIVEDCSCININTGHCMPTDIVNHRLKIAIEVQSWFHDFEKQKIKVDIKKKYWIEKGYKMFQLDQRQYTVLQMIQIFFPHITEIPSYIDFDYSNKFNDIEAQNLLNKYLSVAKVSEIMGCNPHTIYDAISNKRIEYPKGYVNDRYNSVVQLDLDLNYVAEYETIESAQKTTNVCGISYVLRKGRNFCGGYYWVRKSDYDSGEYIIKRTRLKKHITE